MSRTFSITKEGINIPYRTFLADSASGLILILLLMLCYKFPIVTPAPLRTLIPGSANASPFGQEVTVFIMFALFLLATPLGFALNAVSWLLLDQSIDALEEWCSRRPANAVYPVSAINAARHVELVATQLGLRSASPEQEQAFTSGAWFFRELLEAPQLSAFAPDTAARGLMILFRNLTVVLLAASAVSLYSAHVDFASRVGVLLVVALTCLVLTMRWRGVTGERRRLRQRVVIISALVATSTAVTLVVKQWDDRFAAQAPVLALMAFLIVFLQGIIGYYHRTLIMLNVYFAARSVDASLPASQVCEPPAVIEVAADILRKALKANERAK